MSVPDLRFINRKIPINEIARALGLRMGENRNIYCWRPELHKNADRTPSVGCNNSRKGAEVLEFDKAGPIPVTSATFRLDKDYRREQFRAQSRLCTP